MPWDDEKEIKDGYTKKELENFDTEAFFRQNHYMIKALDRELLSLIKRIDEYEEKLKQTTTNKEIEEYLKRLFKQKRECEINLYYFEDIVSGYSNRY